MQAGIYSYLVATKVQSDLAAAAAKVVNYRQPSYGTFGSSLAVSYYFGLPSKVGFSGVAMDVDKLADNAESTTNCWNDWSDFNRQTGSMLSYLENLIPEQLFSTEDNQLDGISAVKALAIAGQQGQKIYTLTSSNANLLSEVTIDSDARQEVQSALSSGKEVTVHQEPINEFGWTGSGYVVIDPDTGAGGYKLNGGGNGGFLGLDNDTWGVLGFATGTLLKANPIALLLSIIISLRLLYIDLLTYSSINHNCSALSSLLVIPILFSFAAIAFSPLMAVISLYASLIATKAAIVVANSSACRR
ncbi:hypothetical protein NBRC116592_36020 [Colwellia sp. KU-HH00111]|uniref:hypothetical protein n=1 Tax=Colwellia sp. KU-HH00111 TaxID=3127652 RepID=UPI00310B8268